MIGPLPLTLKTRKYCIMSKRLFTKAQFFEFWISDHQITCNECHFNNNFPFFILLFSGLWSRVKIFPLFAVFLCPFKCFYKFHFIKNLLSQPPVEFTHINILISHSKKFLEKIFTYY